MSFVVAGVVLLLALVVGTVSFVITPSIQNAKNVSSDDEVATDTTPATTFSSFFQSGNRKQWAVVIVCSLLCAVSVYLLYNTGMSVIDLCRYSAAALFLLSVMIIDGKTHLIPNVLILTLLGIGVILLVVEFIAERDTALETLLLSGLGLLCGLVLFYILARLTKGGISMGDVKLIAAMGWVLGISITLFAVFFAMLICCVAAIILLLSKKKNKNDRVPFGPFMFFGYILLLVLISL